MAWTAPMTAVANAVFTAAQFNTHVRDNLLETAPAKATTVNSYFVSNGANSIGERIPGHATVATSQTTTSTTYTDLTTVGPVVNVDTGTKALVFLKASILNATSGTLTHMGFAVSGTSTIAASDAFSIDGTTTTAFRIGGAFIVTGLTPGTNTFTAKYRVSAATTGTFADRDLIVLPF